jgi:hypothetical protein
VLTVVGSSAHDASNPGQFRKPSPPRWLRRFAEAFVESI